MSKLDGLGHEIIQQFETGAVRSSDESKLRWDLTHVRALEQVLAVSTWGAKKYSAWNWWKGIPWSRMFASAMRHIWAWWKGEDNDSESGLPHLAHAAWNILCLLEFAAWARSDLDDRPMKGV